MSGPHHYTRPVCFFSARYRNRNRNRSRYRYRNKHYMQIAGAFLGLLG